MVPAETIAALLPLVFANRWVYTLGAALAGVGVGLFIDEVGKFITQANDYFYPLAAPIVYAFFLLTVMLYQRVRRRRRREVRAELFQALEALEEVLEQDLDEIATLEASPAVLAPRVIVRGAKGAGSLCFSAWTWAGAAAGGAVWAT